jgi:hypothetical protein
MIDLSRAREMFCMFQSRTGLWVLVAAASTLPLQHAKADPIAGWIVAGAVANTLLKAPFYDRPSDIGPRYGYPIYGYPGYLRPGYRYAAYNGPGAWLPPDPDAPRIPPTTCYWTNRPGPQGMSRVRICY